MRRVASLIGAGLFILVPAMAQGQVLRMASTNHNMEAVNPLSFANSVGYGVAEMLTRATPDGGYEPWLLESIENTDDLTWVMTLRPGVTFQNGRALDAEALVDTITHRLETAAGVRAAFPESARFTATGPLEVTVTSDVPFPSLPDQLAQNSNILVYDAEAVRGPARTPTRSWARASIPAPTRWSAMMAISPSKPMRITGRASRRWTE